MSDLGSLDLLLKDESEEVTNLDWLKVDEEDYRALKEVLPRQNLDSIPDLEQAWAQLGIYDPRLRLQDNDQRNRDSDAEHGVLNKSPFWSEKWQGNAAAQQEVLRCMKLYFLKLLDEGKAGQALLEGLRSNFPDEAYDFFIKKVSNLKREREGIQGVLFQDASLYPSCHSGKKASLSKKSKAPYLLAKPECLNCIKATDNKCSVFDKELIFDIQPAEEDWEVVKPIYAHLGKARLASLEKRDIKDRLRAAALLSDQLILNSYAELSTGIAEDAPIHIDPSGRASLKESLNALKQSEVFDSQHLQNSHNREELSLYAEKLLAGDDITQELKVKAHLKPLIPHVGLMGKLYVDVSFFPTWDHASRVLASYNFEGKHLFGNPYMDKSKRLASFPGLNHPDLVASVMGRFALTKGMAVPVKSRQGSTSIEILKPETLRSVRDFYASLSETKKRSFARKAYASPVPAELNVYATMAWQGESELVSTEEAIRALNASKIPHIKVYASEAPKKAARALFKRMASSGQLLTQDLIAEIELLSDPYKAEVRRHAGLVGVIYGIKDAEISYPSQLPVWNVKKQAFKDFLLSPKVLSRISSVLGNAYGEQKALKVLAKLNSENLDGLLALTKKALQVKKTNTYSGPLYEDLQQHIARIASGSRNKVAFSLANTSIKDIEFQTSTLRQELGQVVKNSSEIMDKTLVAKATHLNNVVKPKAQEAPVIISTSAPERNYTKNEFNKLLSFKLKNGFITRNEAKSLLLDKKASLNDKVRRLQAKTRKVATPEFALTSTSQDSQISVDALTKKALLEKQAHRLMTYLDDEIKKGSTLTNIIKSMKLSFDPVLIKKLAKPIKAKLKKATPDLEMPELQVSSLDAEDGTTLLDEFEIRDSNFNQSLEDLSFTKSKTSSLKVKVDADNLNLTSLMGDED